MEELIELEEGEGKGIGGGSYKREGMSEEYRVGRGNRGATREAVEGGHCGKVQCKIMFLPQLRVTGSFC